jgi:hypothetical protein
LPVDLPTRPEPEGFVFFAVVVGWSIDLLAGLIAIPGLRDVGLLDTEAATLALRLFFTFMGGYTAAYIAGVRELEHALVMGFFSELTVVVLTLRSPQPAPDWYYAGLFILTVPVAVFGGFLRRAVKS